MAFAAMLGLNMRVLLNIHVILAKGFPGPLELPGSFDIDLAGSFSTSFLILSSSCGCFIIM